MVEATILSALRAVFAELVDGSGDEPVGGLNAHDPGLLRSLDRLTAAQASAVPPSGGASIAAHVDHLRYGLEISTRWNAGEGPDADFAASWKRTTVSESEWAERRAALAREVRAWGEALKNPRNPTDVTAMAGVVGAVVHLAYHMGAIRQIDRSARGPGAE